MQIEHVKVALVILWVGAVAIAGYAGGATSFAGWTILGAMALTAPLVMMRFWSPPVPSMSESIQDVLRRPDGGFTRGGPR